MIDVYVREAKMDDLNFIKNSWIKSFEKYMRSVPRPFYFAGQNKLAIQLLGKSRCYVAANPDNLEQIFGWILFEKLAGTEVMHYIYVKHPYRRYGIGSQLLKMMRSDVIEPCIATFWTNYMDFIKDKWNVVYNPYLLLGEKQ